jgi:biofilm PGA synthesis N-glycosyltransferase PgaC
MHQLARQYALITAARNEAAFIRLTIESVISQTIRPAKWVIVSDGSTDATNELVGSYCERYHWIELIRMPERTQRHYGGKVSAFNTGYSRVHRLEVDYIGNVDGDISFDPDFFEFLLARLQENPRLGIVGTAFTENGVSYDYRFASIKHVSGQCQLFRRACYESIGGYQASQVGGIDVMAVLASRMKGWETRTFTEKSFVHHRKMGSAKYGNLRAKYVDGEKDYLLGGHPLWEVFRCIYQMNRKPRIVGGLMMAAGYMHAWATRKARPMPPEMICFRRLHQLDRLKHILKRSFTIPQ